VEQVLEVYEGIIQQNGTADNEGEFMGWLKQLQANGELWTNRLSSLATALLRLEGESDWN
jgi:hypothetical protein